MNDESSSPYPSDRHLRAYQFAADAHQDRMIPGWNVSCVHHASQVAIEILLSLAANPSGLDMEFAVQCALLQDILDGTSIKPEQVRRTFGKNITEAVQALCVDTYLPDEPPVYLRLIDYLRRIRRQPREVWAVVMADRIVRLHSAPVHLDPFRIEHDVEVSGAIHEVLHEAHPGLANRLMMKIQDYMQYTHKQGKRNEF